MNSPPITITKGLYASDKTCEDVNINQVEQYLIDNNNCYERTLPTELNPSMLNRVYVDLDGFAGNITEYDFDELVDTITTILTLSYDSTEVAFMTSCKFGCNKQNLMNKLSFRINFTKKHGTKKAIKDFVLSTIFPNLQTILNGTIPVIIDYENEENYLSIDMGVYNPKGRKMRMWNSSKDGEKRQNKLFGDATVLDTLITYIPIDSVVLHEIESIEETGSVCDPSSVTVSVSEPPSNISPDLFCRILASLSPHRHNNYNDFITVGFICYNEEQSLSVWEKWAAQSSKNKAGDCAKHWKSFHKGNIRVGTLWLWLKEDNLIVFNELQLQTQTHFDKTKPSTFWSLILNYNHAETARFFYNNKPNAYVFNDSLGWYQLLPTGAWNHFERGREPPGLKTDIWQTLKKINKEHWDTLDPANEEDQPRLKSCLTFSKAIGSRSFIDGVVAFLAANYMTQDLDKKMDESRHLFAFQDKVVDLNTGIIRDISPNDYVCLTTGYDYPTKSDPIVREQVRTFLYSLWEDWEVIEYILTILALQIHGTKKMEEFYVWTGTGGNGKSLLTDLVKHVFGNYFHSIPHACITKRNDKRDATNPAIAQARGKRYVQTQEPEDDDKLQVGVIKELTGGDMITERELFSNPVSFVAQFGLFLLCNVIPKLSKLDGGIKRRMVIIFFPFQFVDVPFESHHRQGNNQMKTMIAKSDAWRNEMILMLLETYKKTCGPTHKIVKPKWITEYTDDYIIENDSVKAWLQENYETGLDLKDKRFKLRGEDLRKRFLEETGINVSDMKADKFKTLMEINGVFQKRESNAFNGFVYSDNGDEIQTKLPAGSYYIGLMRKK